MCPPATLADGPLAEVVAVTRGHLLYQEQHVHAIARVTGWTLAAADTVRRRLAKDLHGERGTLLQQFVEAAVARGVSDSDARLLHGAIRRSVPVAYAKAHAVHLATQAWWAASLRHHHHAHWLWAQLQDGQASADHLLACVADAQRRGVEVLGPDVNAGGLDDRVEDATVRLGLRWIGPLPSGAAEAIVLQRSRSPFVSMADLFDRLPEPLISVHIADTLACAGALDGLNRTDDDLLSARQRAVREARAEAAARSGEPAGPTHPWSTERLVTEEMRALRGLTVAGFALVADQRRRPPLRDWPSQRADPPTREARR